MKHMHTRLTVGLIDELKRKGLNQSQIADVFDVTKQAVSYHKTKYNGYRTPREIALAEFPWNVPEAMAQNSPYKRLRDHGEYMATGGKGMSQDKLKRLESWYRKLRDEDVVLEFNPVYPPVTGVANKGGFLYRRRRESDGNLLIRVNEHTELSESGRLIWAWPPTLPSEKGLIRSKR